MGNRMPTGIRKGSMISLTQNSSGIEQIPLGHFLAMQSGSSCGTVSTAFEVPYETSFETRLSTLNDISLSVQGICWLFIKISNGLVFSPSIGIMPMNKTYFASTHSPSDPDFFSFATYVAYLIGRMLVKVKKKSKRELIGIKL